VLAAKPGPAQQNYDALFAALGGEPHVALAVSGGSDSMAMLRLAERWSKGTVKLTALTVDHGLRREAAAEAAQVAAWCKALSIDHHTLKWVDEKPVTGVQAKARVARYDLMTAWCLRHHVAWLLTAHTQDDQAETVRMRQARTSTVESLAGIWQTSMWAGVGLMRPFLQLRRADLRAFLTELEQPWIDDPSNDDETFERVRVRKAMGGDSIGELAQIATDAGKLARALAQSAKAWLAANLTIYPEGYGAVPRRGFCGLPADLKARVLQQVIQVFGAGNRVEPREIDHILGWITAGGVSRRTLGGAVIASRTETLLFGREAGRISNVPLPVPDSGEIVWDGRFLVRAPPHSLIVPTLKTKEFDRKKGVPSFVQASLPMILLDGGSVSMAPVDREQGTHAKFMRCLR
jgi:tRNA(Ile)-lysidine synthase